MTRVVTYKDRDRDPEDWRVNGETEAVGGAKILQLEALDRAAFVAAPEDRCKDAPVPEKEIAKRIAARDVARAPGKLELRKKLCRQGIARAEKVGNKGLAAARRAELAKLEGGAR